MREQIGPEHPLLVRSGRRKIRAYEPDVALRVCERVAQGELLRDICVEGGNLPTEEDFMRWALQYPEVARALSAAKALSAFSFEEEAVAMGRELKTAQTFLPAKTNAWKVAMEQLRWSAERRNPAQFSNKQPVSVTVPIQINTGLSLDPDNKVSANDVYTIEATIVEGAAPEVSEDEQAMVADTPPLIDKREPKPSKQWAHKRKLKPLTIPQEAEGVRSLSGYKVSEDAMQQL